jgi:hypothetical protein
MKTKYFPLGDMPSEEEMESLNLDTSFASRYTRRHIAAVWNGEKRWPKKGEWYLSGAVVTAYKAPNDLNMSFHIARIVRIKQTVNWTNY